MPQKLLTGIQSTKAKNAKEKPNIVLAVIYSITKYMYWENKLWYPVFFSTVASFTKYGRSLGEWYLHSTYNQVWIFLSVKALMWF